MNGSSRLHTIKRLASVSIVFGILCFPMSSLYRAVASDLPPRQNVVVLLDASGSMNSRLKGSKLTRMGAAMEAIGQIVKEVPQQTQVGLLVFSGEVPGKRNVTGDSIRWAFPLGQRDDNQFIERLTSVRPGGQTPLGAAMLEACAIMSQHRLSRQGTNSYRLVVVTDGQADDPRLVELALLQAETNGILIDVVGLAMPDSHLLATRVHKYYRADDSASLHAALAKVFAEINVTGLDASGKDVFEAIAPIPDRVAAAMIEALVNSKRRPSSPGINRIPRSSPSNPK